MCNSVMICLAKKHIDVLPKLTNLCIAAPQEANWCIRGCVTESPEDAFSTMCQFHFLVLINNTRDSWWPSLARHLFIHLTPDLTRNNASVGIFIHPANPSDWRVRAQHTPISQSSVTRLAARLSSHTPKSHWSWLSIPAKLWWHFDIF